jgi:eukaryotic-like serine/threonine-protein kinase
MDVFRAAHYLRQAALGLQHAHEHHAVHCHVEPANLMLDRTGQVKIIDLGYCRSLGSPLHAWRMDDGTQWPIDFFSPEQAAQNVAIDARTDVYSLGAVFYFLLTGQTPFPKAPATQKLLWIQKRLPQAIRERRPETPPELTAIVMRMMERDRERRYQTANEVAEALAPWADAADPVPPDVEMPCHCKAVQALLAG